MDVEPIGLRYGVYADITVAEAFGFHRSCGHRIRIATGDKSPSQ